MNPAYKEWKTKQCGGAVGGVVTATAVSANPNALPVVSNMDDHMQLNEDLGMDVPLAASTDGKRNKIQCGRFNRVQNSRNFVYFDLHFFK